MYKEQLKCVLIMSLAFMTVFIAFAPLENVISQLFSELGYEYFGQISLFVSYGFFSISTAYSATVICRYGFRVVLVGCAVGFCLFNSQGLIVTEVVNSHISALIVVVVISSIFGIAAGCIWVCQVSYISAATDQDNRNEMFGIFWGIKGLASIIGYLFSALVLTNYGVAVYFRVLVPIGLLSAVLFCFLPDVRVDSQKMESQAQDSLSIKNKLYEYYEILLIRENFDLYCYLATPGIMKAIVSVFNYVVLINCFSPDEGESPQKYEQRKLHLSSIFFLVYGLSQTITGFVIKQLGSMLNGQQMALLGSRVCVVATVLSGVAYYSSNYVCGCASSFLWGFASTFNRSNANTLATLMFDNDIFLLRISYFIFAMSTMTSILLILLIRQFSIFLLIFIFLTIFLWIASRSAGLFANDRHNKQRISVLFDKITHKHHEFNHTYHPQKGEFSNLSVASFLSFRERRQIEMQLLSLQK